MEFLLLLTIAKGKALFKKMKILFSALVYFENLKTNITRKIKFIKLEKVELKQNFMAKRKFSN